MPVNAIANTIVPKVQVELAKALNLEAAPQPWMQTLGKVDATSVTSDTLRFPVFQAPELPSVKAEGEAAKKSSFENYYQDMTFHVLSKEHTWTGELQQDLPDFDAHVKSQATEATNNYMERLSQWRVSIMTGSAVDTGLPTISSTCYDGLNLFTTSTRMRTASGNTITQTGTSGAAIRDDFFSGITRIAAYRHDLSAAKIWPDAASLRWMIEFTPSLWNKMVEAFEAEIVTQSGGFTQSASNTFIAFAKSRGVSVTLVANAYLSGDSWYATVLNPPAGRETFALGERMAPKVIPLTDGNDAQAARTWTEGIVMHSRLGLVPKFIGSAFKVA